jgi:YD repeat-containing protein
VDYTTQYSYDPADRLATVTYPTGETVTQTYNGRGLPYSLSGNVVGNIVTSTLYNKLGQITEINLNNGVKTTFSYWDVGGSYDTTGGYYGRLWEIKSAKGSTVLQDVKHTWDATGNLISRQDVVASETESFSYDFLDRLTSASGPYSQSYTYNQIGNILTMNGSSYTYGSKPHAVTSVGSTSYVYDANGNMICRGTQVILEHPEIGPHIYHPPPYRFSKTPHELTMPAPCLGQHNEYVLKEILGMSDDEVADLLIAGALE